MGEVIGWIAIAGFVAMVAWMSMGALADSLMVTTILTGGREPGDRREPDGVGVMSERLLVCRMDNPGRQGVVVHSMTLPVDPPIAAFTVAWPDGTSTVERADDLAVVMLQPTR